MWITTFVFGVGVFAVLSMVFIVVRKFPQVSMIDTEALPAEQEARKKKAILQDRVSRKAVELSKKVAVTVSGRTQKAGQWISDTQSRLEQMEKNIGQGSPEKKPETTDVKVERLIADAERLVELGDTTAAEERFVEAISWDAKAERAYRGLADLYSQAKRYDQALETLGFLIKMVKREQGCRHGRPNEECQASAAVHVDLAEMSAEAGEIALAMGDLQVSRKYFMRSVSMVPMNPKYLDLLLDTSLRIGDVLTASEVLVKLKSANPENKKISTFEERLQDLQNKV